MATDCLFKITIELKEPIEKEGRWITHINIPCGKCGRCIERRKMEWSFRMSEEMKQSKTTYFATLTYAPETVPYNEYGKKTLEPYHLTKFFKKLRQNQIRTNPTIEHLIHNLNNFDRIKYYAAGEYGEERGRPHYHAIIFNSSINTIEKSWKWGTTHIVKGNEHTISYVMKYLDKRHNKPIYKNIEPEFNTMSEGIGESYIAKNKNWHLQNIDILYVTTMGGIKIPMPKYYREKIFSESDRKEQVIIVTNKLKELKDEQIRIAGIPEYNRSQNALSKTTEKRFKKKIKKRIVD